MGVEAMRKLIPLIGVFLLAGCTTQTGPDSNTEVFQTPEQAAVTRRQKLIVEWRDLATKIANAQRPDITTRRHDQNFAVIFSADGIERTADLSPLTEKLAGSAGKEHEPLRAFLAEQMGEFDRDRLAKMGFEKAKSLIHPLLANTKQTVELTALGHRQPPISTRVVIDLNWIPVVRWPDSDAYTPLDPEHAEAWKVSESQINEAARANLKKTFAQLRAAPFDTTDLPGMGRYAALRDNVDPAIVLLPEFLEMVRKEWKSSDDLVMFLPSRSSVTFIERKNTRLLDRMIPQWSKLYAKVSEPLISQMVLSGDGGLTLFSYAPPVAADPTTRPKGPTTKMAPYVVH